MPLYKYFAIVGSMLLSVFVLTDALFGEPASVPRFNGIYFDGAAYAPRPAAFGARDERTFSDTTTPAERIQQAFDQFSIVDARHLKRS